MNDIHTSAAYRSTVFGPLRVRNSCSKFQLRRMIGICAHWEERRVRGDVIEIFKLL